jgi:cytochrome c-type biogenesis protein CcmH
MRLLAVLAAALFLAAPAAASEQHPTLADLEDEVLCPVCYPETLAQSSSPAAQQVKRFISRRIAAGDTKSEIKRRLVADYGPQILASPSKHGFNLLAWALPLVGVLAGAGILGLLAWRWTRVREPEPEPQQWALNGHPLGPEEERRLDDELARFDG